MKKNCKKTCKICTITTTTPTTTTATTTTTTTARPPPPLLQKICVDISGEVKCSQWKEAGFCVVGHRYYPYMSDKCQKTCQTCIRATTVATTKTTTITTTMASKSNGKFVHYYARHKQLSILISILATASPSRLLSLLRMNGLTPSRSTSIMTSIKISFALGTQTSYKGLMHGGWVCIVEISIIL